MDENKAKINIGDKVVAITKNGGVVIGTLYSIASYMAELDEIKSSYGVMVGTSCVQLKSDDLKVIAPYDYVFSTDEEENAKFLRGIESKHDVKCFDEEGVILPVTTIIDNMMDKNIWDKLTEDEKKDFVRIVGFTKEDVVAIINVLFDLKYENSKPSYVRGSFWEWQNSHNRRKYGLFY